MLLELQGRHQYRRDRYVAVTVDTSAICYHQILKFIRSIFIRIFIRSIDLCLHGLVFGPDGHFYGLHLAYDILANNEDEKLRAARLLCNAAAYIVDHDFIYVDPLTGNRTSWGYWSPAILNAVGSLGKPNERGLNSLEILSYLSVAHKVCNAHPHANPALAHPLHGTYGMALASLVLDHDFGANLVNVHLTNPGAQRPPHYSRCAVPASLIHCSTSASGYGNQGIAWFDFGNSFYTYYSFHAAAPWNDKASKFPLPPALTQEALLTLRRQFLTGLEAFWAARSYSANAEREGLWSEIYHTITGKPGIADPLWVVRRGPNELIDWNTQNSQRKCVCGGWVGGTGVALAGCLLSCCSTARPKVMAGSCPP